MRRSRGFAAAAVAAGLLFAALPAGSATQARRAAPAPGAPGSATDFSGMWQLDTSSSAGGASNFKDAVLQVTQKGERIWIQPVGESRQNVLADEVVVDGRKYEKGVGQEKRGTLQAQWGKDGKSLWLEVVAATDENPRAAVQRSVWRLSDDRKTWIRETVTIANGTTRQSRLVFHRIAAQKPAAAPPKKK